MEALLSVATVARLLGVSRKRVYQMVWEGKLESLRISPRRIRITNGSLKEFLDAAIRRQKDRVRIPQ
jgi:excisionase family DNA binding protein